MPCSQTGSEDEPMPCVGCRLILVSWLLQCLLRRRWTALHQNLQNFPPPSSACLASPALTRSVAIPPQDMHGPSILDDLIPSKVLKMSCVSANLTITGWTRLSSLLHG